MHTVIVTRPEPFNQELCVSIQALGINAIALPMVEVQMTPNSAYHREQILNIDRYHGVICVSRPAAGWLVGQIDRFWPQLPIGIEWLAVGRSSRNILRDFGIPAYCSDMGSNSEAMLGLESLQPKRVNEQRWLLVKGVGGRPLLAEELAARGAQVTEVEVYERVWVERSKEQLAALKQAVQQRVVLVVTSVDLLESFNHTIERAAISMSDMERLHDSPLVTISERIAEQAHALGFNHTVLADQPDNAEIVKTIKGLVDVK